MLCVFVGVGLWLGLFMGFPRGGWYDIVDVFGLRFCWSWVLMWIVNGSMVYAWLLEAVC